MLDVIAKLVDFDPDIFSHQAIQQDFEHKFVGSWVNIDGKFFRVVHLYHDDDEDYVLKVADLKADNHYLKVSQIHKITKHMPETGLYKSKHGVLYLSRIPARQWLKSYAEGKNYQIHLLTRNGDTVPNTHNTVLNPESEFHRETMIDHDNNVWLHWKKVGKLDKRTYQINLQDDTFSKEIQELWPQYRITSGAEPQPVPLDGELITDF